MYRYKATIEYLGVNYQGFQLQKQGKTIASCLNEAILRLTGEIITVKASGRTDSGVNAEGQVIHFDLKKKLKPYQITDGLNFYLRTEDISVLKSSLVKKDFDSRRMAKERFYQYLILNRASPSPILNNRAWHIRKVLNLAKMREASKYLIGIHDFSSFRNSECQAKSPIKAINNIIISKKNDIIKIKISAPSFLHNQIRIIVGSLIDIGKGKHPVEKMSEILEQKSRKAAGMTAPSRGLYFIKVKY